MSLEQITKEMDIAFPTPFDKLLEIGHLSLHFKKIGINIKPLLLATCLEQEGIKRYVYL